MTPIADMVERMFEADSSAEIILLAIRTAETVTLRERDASRFVTIPSRSKAALRAERYRLNLKQKQLAAEANDAAAGDFLGAKTERDANVTTVTPHCDLSSLPSLLKGASEKGSKGTENARARGTRLLLGSPLSDVDRATAIELGAQPDKVDGMWAEFVDYWIGVPGQRGTKLNWSATWRNRVRDVISRGNRNGRQNNGQADRSTSAAAGRVLERIRQLNEPISNRS
jgi:hypothetical protein